ncbi:MAG TPA: 1-phosphofructokinase family hexose kinase [Bryobacteraceae bacterium]|nr:1-phosphofructokinase family hexose kinase [Bryobacteraceae bacterium]
MILTLTINPAIDRSILVDRLVFEDRAYILSQDYGGGGRGIIASRVLQSFGVTTKAVTTSGGKNGQLFEKLLGKAGFPFEVVRIANEIRTNLTITDKQGLTAKLNEVGPELTGQEAAAVMEAVVRQLPDAEWLMLCGSLPPGVPKHFYNELIQAARKHKVQTLLDADGEDLRHGVEAKPTVVSPNQQEAERLLNRALITRAHFREAVTRIRELGAESVLLSLGSRGVVAVNENQMVEAVPPRIDVLSPIGAGDTLAAAFLWAFSRKKDFPDAVRWGVAAGTASAALPGMEFATLEQTKEMYRQVELRLIR